MDSNQLVTVPKSIREQFAADTVHVHCLVCSFSFQLIFVACAIVLRTSVTTKNVERTQH